MRRLRTEGIPIPDLVDITPHVSLLAKIGQSGHSVAEAVAELIDNAIDSRVGDQVRVEVVFDLHEGWIRVQDDGKGMNRASLAHALVLGHSDKGEEQIGKFGLGLKTACTSLGSRFKIWTVTQEGRFANIADYDEQRFIETGDWQLPITRRKKDRPHGTTITVESSRLYPGLQNRMLRTLGWTFRHFLRDGLLSLHVNAVEVQAGGLEIIEDSRLPLRGSVAGKQIHGWVGLLSRSSQGGSYGFALVRHRRIIRRNEKLGFQAHPSTARVVGELHLDSFDTNNLKTDFIRETQTWHELERWVSREIAPILAQSRRLAHAGMLDLKIKAEIAEARRRTLGDADDSPGVPQRLSAATGRQSPPVMVAIGRLQVEHVFAANGPDEPYLSTTEILRPGELDATGVTTNLGHGVAIRMNAPAIWACHNVAEVAAQRLGSAETFTVLKGVILQKLLQDPGLMRALTASARGIADQVEHEDERVASTPAA